MKLTPRTAVSSLAAALLAAAAAPAIALAAPTASAGPTKPATVLSTPRCRTPGLVIWLDTNGQGATQSFFYGLKLTNLSGHACTLRGFPRVSAVNIVGDQIGRAAVEGGQSPGLLTLAPGGTVTAPLQIREASLIPRRLCHPVTAAGLRVYPPNATASKIVPFPFKACSTTNEVYLTIYPVQQ